MSLTCAELRRLRDAEEYGEITVVGLFINGHTGTPKSYPGRAWRYQQPVSSVDGWISARIDLLLAPTRPWNDFLVRHISMPLGLRRFLCLPFDFPITVSSSAREADVHPEAVKLVPLYSTIQHLDVAGRPVRLMLPGSACDSGFRARADACKAPLCLWQCDLVHSPRRALWRLRRATGQYRQVNSASYFDMKANIRRL